MVCSVVVFWVGHSGPIADISVFCDDCSWLSEGVAMWSLSSGEMFLWHAIVDDIAELKFEKCGSLILDHPLSSVGEDCGGCIGVGDQSGGMHFVKMYGVP